MTQRMQEIQADPAYRAGLEALSRIHVEPEQRERVWRLADDLAGPQHPINPRHLQQANALIVEHMSTRLAA